MNIRSQIKKFLNTIFSNWLSGTGFIIILIFIVIAVLYEILGTRIVPYNPYQINLLQANMPPSSAHTGSELTTSGGTYFPE